MFDSDEEEISLKKLAGKRKGKTGKKKTNTKKLTVKIKMPKNKAPTKECSTITNSDAESKNVLWGFDRKLKAERIIGAMKSPDNDNDIMFLIKWKGIDEADLVSSNEANINCPQLVISFYEEHLTWRKSVNAPSTTEKEEKVKEILGEEYTKLQILGEDSVVVCFKLKKTTPMGKLKKAYSEKVGIPVSALRFILDKSIVLNDEATSKSLQLEENYIIEVYQESPHLFDWPNISCCDDYDRCHSFRKKGH